MKKVFMKFPESWDRVRIIFIEEVGRRRRECWEFCEHVLFLSPFRSHSRDKEGNHHEPDYQAERLVPLPLISPCLKPALHWLLV